jgi:hypothetical protein
MRKVESTKCEQHYRDEAKTMVVTNKEEVDENLQSVCLSVWPLQCRGASNLQITGITKFKHQYTTEQINKLRIITFAIK